MVGFHAGIVLSAMGWLIVNVDVGNIVNPER